ncbi:MAG TPA: SPOR domain-containing protein [Bryobacterales bacterium]|nr:SPOR domain-containing protein [Bryobacterales bacterium]
MPRSRDGEFEVVLGNKQLLSLFFLVVALFAVFFSLGYIVGKSVSPVPTMAAQPAGTATTPAASPSLPEPVKEPPSVAVPEAEQPSAAPPTETQPARTDTVAATVPAAAPAATPAPPAAKAAVPGGEGQGSPAAGGSLAAPQINLQVAAVRVRTDAAALAEVLRKKGYPVALHDEAPDGWYRVLVGPFASDKDAQQAKAQLEKDGYKSIVKKP